MSELDSTRPIGQPLFVFDTVSSTNDLAFKQIDHLDYHGAVFHALQQTAGRGQYDRRWQSQPGASLLISVLLFPRVELIRPVFWTVLAGLAVCDVIQEQTGIRAQLKWPNDVLVNGQKIAGILIETRVIPRGIPFAQATHPLAIIIGIGLNLNQTRQELDRLELPQATSWKCITGGADVSVAYTRETLIHHLNKYYALLYQNDQAEIIRRWQEATQLPGMTVQLEFYDGSTAFGRLTQLNFSQVEWTDADGIRQEAQPERIRHIFKLPGN